MNHIWMKGLCIVLLTLMACVKQKDRQPLYAQNSALSDTQGNPRDTTVFYFPAADSLHATYIPKAQRPAEYVLDERVANCAGGLTRASYCLTYFKAPVLSNYYLHANIYRFLWLRSFHRPVLLTLRQDAKGASLRTQLLDKHPGFHTLTAFHPDDLSADATPELRASTKKYYEETMADPAFQAEVAEAKRRAEQVVAEETTSRLTAQQVKAFQGLLAQAQFWQLPGCQPRPNMLDGAYWLLEAHQANAYHMVSRRSPDEGDKFRRACEYLIDLSSVHAEERY